MYICYFYLSAVHIPLLSLCYTYTTYVSLLYICYFYLSAIHMLLLSLCDTYTTSISLLSKYLSYYDSPFLRFCNFSASHPLRGIIFFFVFSPLLGFFSPLRGVVLSLSKHLNRASAPFAHFVTLFACVILFD